MTMFGVRQPPPGWHLVRAGDAVMTPEGLGVALAVFVESRQVQVRYAKRAAGLLVPLDDVNLWRRPGPGQQFAID